jgi:hypothetical protein
MRAMPVSAALRSAGRYLLLAVACAVAVLAAYGAISAAWRGMCLENVPADTLREDVCDIETAPRRRLLVIGSPLFVLATAVAVRRPKPLMIVSGIVIGVAVLLLSFLAIVAA